MNLASGSVVAATCPEAARDRVLFLREHGARRSLELCVGPSLQVLRDEGRRVGLEVRGNDADPRWIGMDVYGDCLRIDWAGSDAVVFAPPLSRGCSGRREDALRVDEVEPSYSSFLLEWRRRFLRPDLVLLVLPGRCLATKRDREAFYRLRAEASRYGRIDVEHVLVGKRLVRKYVHLLVRSRGRMEPHADERFRA